MLGKNLDARRGAGVLQSLEMAQEPCSESSMVIKCGETHDFRKVMQSSLQRRHAASDILWSSKEILQAARRIQPF